MIEETLYKFLKSKLKWPVYFEKPDQAPDDFILMMRVGGGKDNRLDSGTFAFQSYGQSLYSAMVINNALKAVVESLIELNDVASVQYEGDYNFPDLELKKHRYQAVFQVYYY